MGLIVVAAAISCTEEKKKDPETSRVNPIKGTWKLLTGTLIEKGDTVITDYTTGRSFIKIINDSHFAFLNHTLRKDTTPKNGRDVIFHLP